MRVAHLLLPVALIFAMTSKAVSAPLLKEKDHEWSLSYSFVDVENAASLSSLDFQIQWGSASGYHQLGFLLSYVDLAVDDVFLGADISSLLWGPVYTFNFMPSSDRGTIYAQLAGGLVGGDAKDLYELFGRFAIGGKMFAGESAAVRIEYFQQVQQGNMSRIPDLESRGFAIGMSIFTGARNTSGPVAEECGGDSAGQQATASLGRVTINANAPDASVFINGSLIGTTPLLDLPLSAGTHVVRILKKGYRPWQEELMVIAGASVQLNIELEVSSGQ